MSGKIIVLSAPSGTGKSTIIKQIINDPELDLHFSVSATSRQPREGEQHGREYYFITLEEFDRLVEEDKFVEWEEVYAGTRYGTLTSEVDRITRAGHNLILDIDVAGGMNVKKRYGDRALALFILPPSLEALSERLHSRGTDSEEVIAKRLAKAEYELSFAERYDERIVNDNLEEAVAAVRRAILDFIKRT